MKNLFILMLFALLSLTSCKKDYTCECTSYLSGVKVTSESTTITDTESKADEACDKGDYAEDILGISVDCEIK